MNSIKLKSRVRGEVNFVQYKDGNLIYVCDDGFEFPVPITDCGSATFPTKDKGMFFMRWIRKHMALITSAEKDA